METFSTRAGRSARFPPYRTGVGRVGAVRGFGAPGRPPAGA